MYVKFYLHYIKISFPGKGSFISSKGTGRVGSSSSIHTYNILINPLFFPINPIIDHGWNALERNFGVGFENSMDEINAADADGRNRRRIKMYLSPLYKFCKGGGYEILMRYLEKNHMDKVGIMTFQIQIQLQSA